MGTFDKYKALNRNKLYPISPRYGPHDFAVPNHRPSEGVQAAVTLNEILPIPEEDTAFHITYRGATVFRGSVGYPFLYVSPRTAVTPTPEETAWYSRATTLSHRLYVATHNIRAQRNRYSHDLHIEADNGQIFKIVDRATAATELLVQKVAHHLASYPLPPASILQARRDRPTPTVVPRPASDRILYQYIAAVHRLTQIHAELSALPIPPENCTDRSVIMPIINERDRLTREVKSLAGSCRGMRTSLSREGVPLESLPPTPSILTAPAAQAARSTRKAPGSREAQGAVSLSRAWKNGKMGAYVKVTPAPTGKPRGRPPKGI